MAQVPPHVQERIDATTKIKLGPTPHDLVKDLPAPTMQAKGPHPLKALKDPQNKEVRSKFIMFSSGLFIVPLTIFAFFWYFENVFGYHSTTIGVILAVITMQIILGLFVYEVYKEETEANASADQNMKRGNNFQGAMEAIHNIHKNMANSEQSRVAAAFAATQSEGSVASVRKRRS